MFVSVCIFIKQNDDNSHLALAIPQHIVLYKYVIRTKVGQLKMGEDERHTAHACTYTSKVQCYIVGLIFGPTVKFDRIACFACIIYLVINWMTSNGPINPTAKATHICINIKRD